MNKTAKETNVRFEFAKIYLVFFFIFLSFGICIFDRFSRSDRYKYINIYAYNVQNLKAIVFPCDNVSFDMKFPLRKVII